MPFSDKDKASMHLSFVCNIWRYTNLCVLIDLFFNDLLRTYTSLKNMVYGGY